MRFIDKLLLEFNKGNQDLDPKDDSRLRFTAKDMTRFAIHYHKKRRGG